MPGSQYYPFYVHLEFAGKDDPRITTPVDRVLLGYERDDGPLAEFTMSGESMWKDVSEFVHGFSNACSRNISPVGWNLRNLVWPSIVLNCVRCGLGLCPELVMRPDSRWNDSRLIDLSSVVMQGGWNPSGTSMNKIAEFLGIGGLGPLQTLREIHSMYRKARE